MKKSNVRYTEYSRLKTLKKLTFEAREIGYESISFDLIYGLPFQSPSTISDTIEKVLTLKPDRIAFYSYAHVPWLKPGQRGYADNDLPSEVLKRQLYEVGRQRLKSAGYVDIGMDHFALPQDSLYTAHFSGKLHRNFMGYTTSNTDLLIGLGASAISDAGRGYAQNEKKVEAYLHGISNSGSAIFKGHILSDEDLLLKECILRVCCQGTLSHALLRQVANPKILKTLQDMEQEGIIELFDGGGLKVTAAGHPFIRNICSVFDKRMNKDANHQQVFSKAI